MDAVLSWVAAEAGRFSPGAPTAALALRLRVADMLLVLLAAAPAAALVA